MGVRQIPPASEPIRKNLAEARFRCGADNGTRTRGLNLGKVALYQLSYVRKGIRREKRNPVGDVGIEPTTPWCERSALAAAPIARILGSSVISSRIASTFVGDTRFELVTPSVSGKCATTAPTARVIFHPIELLRWSERWVRESNSSIRLCRPLPNRLANPP